MICFQTAILLIHNHGVRNQNTEVPDWVPPQSGAGWFRKMAGLLVCWKLGEVHRMRRLLQRWEQVPVMADMVNSLMTHVKAYGWPKNLEGEFGLTTP